jgi:hypothetical protein
LLLLVPSSLWAADLYNATVEVSPKKTGAAAQYTFGFNVSGTGALEGGRDEIIIYFPEGTKIPATLNDELAADSIIVNGYNVEPRLVYADATRVFITLPSEVNVRAYGYVGVIISQSVGIELPRKAGKHYWEVETSRDNRVYTNSFSINGSKISNLEISGSPAAVDKFAAYDLSFRTSYQGGLVPEKDSIYLEFPREISLPRAIVSGDVQVNGEKPLPGGVTINEQTNTLQIAVPPQLKISDGEIVQVQIDCRAGIRNPRKAGIYRIKVYTSGDSVSSGVDYSVGMSISAPVVLISPNQAGEKGQYSVGFTTSMQGALRSGKDYIHLYFPSDTFIPYSISPSYITVNGYAAEAVETSKSDRIVSVRVPFSANINNETYVSIVIKSEAGVLSPNNSGNYQIEVCTSADNNKVSSKEYSISGTGVYKPIVNESTCQPGELLSLQMLFQGAALGDLRRGDKVTLIFPTAFTFPGQINKKYITVNGREIENLEMVGQALLLTVPSGAGIDYYEDTQISIGSGAGIKTPRQEGQYSIIIYSSTEPGRTFNHVVTIGSGTASGVVSKPTVELSSVKTGDVSSYTVSFTNKSVYSLSGGSIISFSFPAGTVVPEMISRSFVRINGDTPDRVEVDGNKVLIYLPADMQIRDTEKITVLISKIGNIKNPLVAGNYTLQVETSQGYYAETENYTVEEAFSGSEEKIVFKIGSTTAYKGSTAIVLDTPPTILENFTVVPLRALGDALGAETAYEATTRTVKVKYNQKELVFYIDSKLVKVDEQWVTADIPATIINDRVMIPARFVSQSFGAAVTWDEETREVTIIK